MTENSRDRETVRPTAQPVQETFRQEEEQRALSLALAVHADPTVRLIAAISQRQLAMSEVIRMISEQQTAFAASLGSALVEFREGIASLNQAMENLQQEQGQLDGRVTELRKITAVER